jgi:drug/metabolite transporter superfamily protein YnfA
MWNLLREFWQHLRTEKRWWLVPLVLILLVLGAVLLLSSGPGTGWAIYQFK